MKDYGRIRSTVYPDEIVVDDYSVWVNTDIVEIEVTQEDETHIEYEYNMMQYTKDEYIHKLIVENKENNILLNTILGVSDNG